MVANESIVYEGKAKKLIKTADENIYLMFFKDSLTAFNAVKKGDFAGKGKLNCLIATQLFKLLTLHKIKHHWIETKTNDSMFVVKTKMIPLEVVVRNTLAGSLAKKLNRPEGEVLHQPIVEFYYKDDLLNDPFVNDEQIISLGWETQSTLKYLKLQALEINSVLLPYLNNKGLNLVDFKLEFGRNPNNEIILADEISPDSMRLWDTITRKKMDKDLFRYDLGNVEQAYTEVLQRLQKEI